MNLRTAFKRSMLSRTAWTLEFTVSTGVTCCGCSVVPDVLIIESAENLGRIDARSSTTSLFRWAFTDAQDAHMNRTDMKRVDFNSFLQRNNQTINLTGQCISRFSHHPPP